jgi:WD40 repeat protein
MRVLRTTGGEVVALAFSASGDALAAAVPNHGLFLWNLNDGGDDGVHLDSSATLQTRALHFTPDGRSLAWFAGQSRKVYNRDQRRAAVTKFATPGRLIGMTQTPDGGRLVTQHIFPEPALIGWSGAGVDWEQDWSINTESLSVHTVAACPTGKRLAVLCRETRPGRFWDMNPIQLELRSAVNGIVRARTKYPPKYGGPLLFSPDGTQVVGSNDMTLLVWPVPGLGAATLIRNDSRKHFTSLAYHPTGRHLFAASNDGTVHVFDTTTWERVRRFKWGLGRLRSVAVSPDGTLAAAGGDRGEVAFWDVDL